MRRRRGPHLEREEEVAVGPLEELLLLRLLGDREPRAPLELVRPVAQPGPLEGRCLLLALHLLHAGARARLEARRLPPDLQSDQQDRGRAAHQGYSRRRRQRVLHRPPQAGRRGLGGIRQRRGRPLKAPYLLEESPVACDKAEGRPLTCRRGISEYEDREVLHVEQAAVLRGAHVTRQGVNLHLPEWHHISSWGLGWVVGEE